MFGGVISGSDNVSGELLFIYSFELAPLYTTTIWFQTELVTVSVDGDAFENEPLPHPMVRAPVLSI